MLLAIIDATALATQLGLVLVQVTVLLLAATLVQRWLVHSPAARHAVLGWALIFCGVCPLVTVLVSYADVEAPIVLPSAWSPVRVAATARPDVRTPFTPTIIPTEEQSADGNSKPVILQTLLVLWAFGSAVSLVRLTMGLRMIARVRRSARTLSNEAFRAIEPSLGTLLDGKIANVFESDQLTAPVTISLRRPMIVLPANLATRLNRQQLLQVVAHECAHVLRGDPRMGLYQRLLSAAFWFHPLVHLANRQLIVPEKTCVITLCSARRHRPNTRGRCSRLRNRTSHFMPGCLRR